MSNRLVARIIGMGSYLPKNILTNSDLEKMVETSDEWIVSRTGMRERRIAETNEFTSDLGAQAALQALAHTQLTPKDIELIIVTTMTVSYTHLTLPTTSRV